MFAGQYCDSEIDECYMRARQYDININRFTSRDPASGEFKEPLTLHVYLYCINDPVNGIDQSGEFTFHLADAIITGSAFYGHTINLAAYGAASGDLRFFDLAAATGKFMTAGWAIALVEPLGVWDRFFTYVLETYYERRTGSITGFTWEEALSLDVIAFASYYSYMLYVENKLDIDVDDMQDFIDWKREFWQ